MMFFQQIFFRIKKNYFLTKITYSKIMFIKFSCSNKKQYKDNFTYRDRLRESLDLFPLLPNELR